jgi:hypothetical protein
MQISDKGATWRGVKEAETWRSSSDQGHGQTRSHCKTQKFHFLFFIIPEHPAVAWWQWETDKENGIVVKAYWASIFDCSV